MEILIEATDKQSGTKIHSALAEGLKQLPLYGFYLSLVNQRKITSEQKNILQLYFKNFEMPFTLDQFLQATKHENETRRALIKMVGISESSAGEFWVQFFKVLYRTDDDTSSIEKLLHSFCMLTINFSVLSKMESSFLSQILEDFWKNVNKQAVICRDIPDDPIDYYGDHDFVYHYDQFITEAYTVCNYGMDLDNKEFTPAFLIEAFTVGIIYQIIRRSRRSRSEKIKMVDDILSRIGAEIEEVDGAYVFKYMDERSVDNTTLFAAFAHMCTDLENGSPSGWILLMRMGGTYSLEQNVTIHVIEEAINFLIGMENYLADKYPLSGFGSIASDYTKKIMDILLWDIENEDQLYDF